MEKRVAGSGPGDSGESCLADGMPLPKSDPVFSVLGDLDELSSQLGVVRAGLPESSPFLRPVQEHLIALGAAFAGAGERGALCARIEEGLAFLDERLACLYTHWKPEAGFVLPGDHFQTACLDLSRAVCRRLERSLVAFAGSDRSALFGLSLCYLNRLSRFLFVYARTLE